MKKYEFTIIASGLDPEAKEFYDRFYEAGRDRRDHRICERTYRLRVRARRENFSDALATSVRDVRNAGAAIEHIEPDYLVSLSILQSGARSPSLRYRFMPKGPGQHFPAPIARLTTDSPLWDRPR